MFPPFYCKKKRETVDKKYRVKIVHRKTTHNFFRGKTMTNMLSTIIPKTDQQNADMLIGGPRTIKISKISIATGDQPVALHFEGDDDKPYKPCKSMRRVLVTVWGEDGNAYVGRSLTLYCDIKVTFGGAAVGGIRISHMSHIDKPVTILLTASKANKKPFTVQPLKVTAAPTTAPDPSPELLAAGAEAASKGIEAYTAWGKALTPEEKAALKPHLSGWTTIAKAADAAKTTEEEIPV